MFREALLESSPVLHKRSPWPMATAFTLQFIIASALTLLPLISTGILPLNAHLAPPPQYVPIDPVREAPAATANTTHNTVNLPNREVVQVVDLNPALPSPFRIPRGAPSDTVAPSANPQIGVEGGCSSCNMLIPDYHTPPPPPIREFVISHSMEAFLLNKVIPEYPVTARLAGVQGDVKLHAIIAKDGTIQSLTVTSGPVLLQEAALKAVQQWRYRPYMLNGVAVEVETVITVSFKRS
jgi:periplasmic protein TonB